MTPPLFRAPAPSVEIAWSENGAIGSNQVFRSLDAADAYVAAALTVEPPPPIGYDKTFFVVTWPDGYRFEGRADIRVRDVGKPVLRQHLARACRQYVAWYGAGLHRVTADEAGHAREILRRVDPPDYSDEETRPGTFDD